MTPLNEVPHRTQDVQSLNEFDEGFTAAVFNLEEHILRFRHVPQYACLTWWLQRTWFHSPSDLFILGGKYEYVLGVLNHDSPFMPTERNVI